MRRGIATAAVLAVCLVAAAPAADAAGPTLRSLQAQITTLKKQVKTLKKREKQDRTLIVGSFVYTGCTLAATADALQNTWTTYDQHNTPVFGAQTPVNDYTTCQAFQVTRARTQVPPSAGVLQALLDTLFKPSASSFAYDVAMNLASQGRDLLRQLLVLPR